ncbi:hypothetical protein TWF696_007580 [Orbilia brochopaga]|uniref:Uncharacterized protein n=1 Tax=Orbilia brochopaga TaxID=3140254 RepID=A0AAV9UNY2_9PEZI
MANIPNTYSARLHSALHPLHGLRPGEQDSPYGSLDLFDISAILTQGILLESLVRGHLAQNRISNRTGSSRREAPSDDVMLRRKPAAISAGAADVPVRRHDGFYHDMTSCPFPRI